MYTTKDLANLLQLMQTSRQSGDLIIEPTKQEAVAWQGYFRLIDGQIATCWIRNKLDGQIRLRGDEAVRWLTGTNHGKLEWSLEEGSQSSEGLLPVLPTSNETTEEPYNENTIQTHSSKHSIHKTSGSLPLPQGSGRQQTPYQATWDKQSAIIPRRTMRGMQISSNTLASRDHRQVFSLIDGHRNVAEIARLLHKPPDHLIQILRELGALEIIE